MAQAQVTELKVKITFTEDVLGSAPNNQEIYADYIGSKAPDAASKEEEVAAVGAEGVLERQMTVFPKDEHNKPFVWDYQIKGYFKDSCGFLRKVGQTESSKIKAFKKEIDGLIFPQPRRIYFTPKAGETGIEIGDCQRPLRAQTAQGERIALAMSETIPAGCGLEFRLLVLKQDLVPMVKECLDYGSLHGFGQWRNSGAGRFSWQLLSETTGELADYM